MKFSLLMLSLLLLVELAMAEDFSADMRSNNKGEELQGRIYCADKKMRIETNGTIAIARQDRSIMWLLIPDKKIYLEMPLRAEDVVAGKEKLPGEIERQLMSKEVIDGQETEKYRIVYKAGNKEEIIYSWVLAGKDMPVKTASEDNSRTTEYKNIKIESFPNSLFEIPPGYIKFSSQAQEEFGAAKLLDYTADE